MLYLQYVFTSDTIGKLDEVYWREGEVIPIGGTP